MQIALNKIDLPEHDLRATIDEDELDSLANSMAARGQLQSIGVREKPNGRFEVVYGARRTRAATILKWPEIRAEIITAGDDDNTAADKLTENIQRQDLTPIEEAYGLLAMAGTDEPDPRALARLTGKSRDWINTRLRLAAMHELLQQAVQGGHVTIGAALEFAVIQNEKALRYFIDQAIKWGCTADQAKGWATQADAVITGLDHAPQTDEELAAALERAEYIRQIFQCQGCRRPHEQKDMAMITLCRSCFPKANGAWDIDEQLLHSQQSPSQFTAAQ